MFLCDLKIFLKIILGFVCKFEENKYEKVFAISQSVLARNEIRLDCYKYIKKAINIIEEKERILKGWRMKLIYVEVKKTVMCIDKLKLLWRNIKI